MPWISAACKFLVAGTLAVFAGAQATPANTTSPASASPQLPEKPLLIMLDPAHGGTDPGARLTASTPEKEITLNIARRLKQELNARGILCQLVREGDVTLPADQRAAMINAADPALTISLHASSLGSGMGIFTALLPDSGDNKGPFLDWDRAQSATLPRSKALQTQLVGAMQKTRFPTHALSASLRPLNSLRSPAIAIEISPTTGDATQVSANGYQQMICAALANALASMAPSLRGNMGARR
jgi:N-acetylmuramoyl-L-alanine amidase